MKIRTTHRNEVVLHRPTLFIWAFFAAITLAFNGAFGGEPALKAHDYKMAGDAQYTRIVIHFDEKPEFQWFLLRDPNRLVIDLPLTEFSFDPLELRPRGLVAAVQYGAVDAARARLLFRAVGPFSVEKAEVMKNETSDGFRLIIEIRASSADDFDAALRAAMLKPKAEGPGGGATGIQDRFTVALDPGHGGADGGARGINGTIEKQITLLFALELAGKLEETGRYRVVLTREDDRFLRLDERVRIAREKGADLFVSVHADAIAIRSVRGATVYTVSDKASDAEAAATAARENLSDEIAGKVPEEEQDEVEDILVDLIRRETHAFSIRFARTLIGRLSDTVQLVKNPHRYAGFRVLRAPDIPSVLLELGYLSNPEDEAQLRDPKWRAETMDAIVEAVGYFAKANGGAGG
ncbi:N-acetylmuramoyl-L-alanine amidase [Nitratireductor kimnyeongensis]|uniref:N-acetylmuramoyl-L-alanine amidase n=1 Tax=Nitratireductor kimnyeongensis TaxID=430679 RepID=A0ABW0T958_9HYPH|nr:N-acetylmuramoyl-L-alanine amidase [Nitratireductor kimnyeongensis]QZZ35633.1 N-acetylmuramoyl-L-alanine amidase [Nitratireductor kimnyeongensis]